VHCDTWKVVVAWVEGGGQPILRSTAATLEDAYEWAVSHAAEGVLVRRRGEAQAHWHGPGDDPFNKSDLLPISQMRPRVVAAGGWWASVPPADDKSASYRGYWSDRAWWALNPDAASRHRPLGEDELEELMEKTRRLDGDHPYVTPRAQASEVVVSRYDMFLEGGLHLRGMIREREVPELDIVFTDAEDAVNPHFLAGPPQDVTPSN